MVPGLFQSIFSQNSAPLPSSSHLLPFGGWPAKKTDPPNTCDSTLGTSARRSRSTREVRQRVAFSDTKALLRRAGPKASGSPLARLNAYNETTQTIEKPSASSVPSVFDCTALFGSLWIKCLTQTLMDPHMEGSGVSNAAVNGASG